MTNGLHSFVYREIRELRSHGVLVVMFPTRVGTGPYMPAKDWPVYRPTLVRVIGAHLRWVTADSRPYLKALFEATRMNSVIDFILAVSFAETILKCGLKQIHSHFGDHKLFIAYFCGLLTGLPVSATIHAYELYDNPNPRMFKHALSKIDAIVTIAEHNRSVLTDTWGAPAEKISVVPMFADIPPDPQHEPNGQGKVIILTVARLVEKKGHSTLLRAISRLPKNYEAWLVGSGPLNIEALAIRLGVADRVRILGRVSNAELDQLYRRADIFCLASETAGTGDREGIPVALMEAMAHALPVVATKHAGIPELVEEILVSERDPDQLSEALWRLGADAALRSKSGQRNYRIVQNRFSRDNVLLLKSIFESLVR
ncbi:MAG TPA: glycosyltransferase family 4 protein [Thermoplasmata archaeon]